MGQVRQIGWIGLAISAVAVTFGLVFAIGSAIAAGDWLLAPSPGSGWV